MATLEAYYKLDGDINTSGLGSNGTNYGLSFDSSDKPNADTETGNTHSADVATPGTDYALIPLPSGLGYVGPETEASFVLWLKLKSDYSGSSRGAAFALCNASGDFTMSIGVPYGPGGNYLGVDIGKSYTSSQYAMGAALTLPSDWICVGVRLQPKSGGMATVMDTTPIQVTETGHGLESGQWIYLNSAGGKSGLTDGTPYMVTVIDADNFTIDGTSSGGDDYTGGGSWRAGKAVYFQDGVLTDRVLYDSNTLTANAGSHGFSLGAEGDATEGAGNPIPYPGDFKIDAIRIYSGLLSDSEFGDLAELGAPPPTITINALVFAGD